MNSICDMKIFENYDTNKIDHLTDWHDMTQKMTMTLIDLQMTQKIMYFYRIYYYFKKTPFNKLKFRNIQKYDNIHQN